MERRRPRRHGRRRNILSFFPRPSNPPLIHAAEPAALHFLSTKMLNILRHKSIPNAKSGIKRKKGRARKLDPFLKAYSKILIGDIAQATPQSTPLYRLGFDYTSLLRRSF